MVVGVSIPTSYRYAPSGKIDRVMDAMGNKTQTHYDVLGRPTQKQDPDVGTTDLTYDGFGELITEKHQGSGESTTYQFDALGRLYDTLAGNRISERPCEKSRVRSHSKGWSPARTEQA